MRVLFIDIETRYMELGGWGAYDQNFSPKQIIKDWCIIAFAAQWMDSDEMIYMDNRNKSVDDDKHLCKVLWKLLDEADIVCGHNSNRFDLPKINARMVKHGLKPYSSVRKLDTCSIAKRLFGFTFNKLEYLAEYLNVKYKKLTVRKYDGFSLWRECVNGNLDAWNEMERYNKRDVLAQKEVYFKLIPWDKGLNFHYEDGACSACGTNDWRYKGHVYKESGIYKRYRCKNCGKNVHAKKNLLTVEQKKKLKTGVAR